MHALLSSYALQWISGVSTKISINCANSFRRVIVGNTSRRAVLSAIYSASVVDRAIWVCNLLTQYIGQPAYLSTKPVRDRTFSALSTSVRSQPPAKSASTKHSRPFFLSGLNLKPKVLVPLRYFPIRLIARS